MTDNINDQITRLAQWFPELNSGVEARRTLAWFQAKIDTIAPDLADDWKLIQSSGLISLSLRSIFPSRGSRTAKRFSPLAGPGLLCMTITSVSL